LVTTTEYESAFVNGTGCGADYATFPDAGVATAGEVVYKDRLYILQLDQLY
jgi:hypothetical protein